MSLLMKAAVRGEKLIYRIGGLPVALRASSERAAGCGGTIRRAFAKAYWHPSSWGGYVELGAAWLLWPIALIGGSLWFTARNGPLIRNRYGRAPFRQFLDQLKLYFSDGVLAPWYYIFDLAEEPTSARASAFVHRFEAQGGVYALLRQGVSSELNDKKLFADHCIANGVRCVPYLLYLDGKSAPATLPEGDLFVKPANSRGGRGAERWDRVAQRLFRGPGGEELMAGELLERLSAKARSRPLLVQPRLDPHPQIADLTSGALPTVRLTTCLDEQGEPEAAAALFRTGIGGNRTVDNIHAGGLGAMLDLKTGELGKASNLGMDARLGWVTDHPDTGARIAGRKLPLWEDTKALAVQAHRAFADRAIVGWDIAITPDGPIIVEGNSSPDLDIAQRFGVPACTSRVGGLLAWHLEQRGFA